MSAGEIPAAVLSLCSGSSVKDQVSQITFALLDGGGKKGKEKGVECLQKYDLPHGAV